IAAASISGTEAINFLRSTQVLSNFFFLGI
ncbi:unnamed protein product, partial [marine sediment metagenome]